MSDSEVLTKILELMDRVDSTARSRIVQTLQTFYGVIDHQFAHINKSSDSSPRELPKLPVSQVGKVLFSEDRSQSPKEFLFEKKPQTDIEKVACLAYYLAHYLGVENFKTLDISKLNTEAAQIKFSNAAQAVDNAARAGFLIGSTKGQKKISALGELYVQALPDRSAAREAIAHAKPKRRVKSQSQKR